MLERELQQQVIDLAKMLGYLVWHAYDSRRSAPGFPDLVMVHERNGATLYAELKRDGQHPTVDQRRWLHALALRGAAYVWRPADLRSGEIARVLTRWART